MKSVCLNTQHFSALLNNNCPPKQQQNTLHGTNKCVQINPLGANSPNYKKIASQIPWRMLNGVIFIPQRVGRKMSQTLEAW